MPKKSRLRPSQPHALPPELPGDAQLAGLLMGRQARLSAAVAAAFLLLLLALPLLNAWWPAAMQRRVIGFPLSWLLIGVLSYPLTWLLAGYFVRRSEALEAGDVRLARERG